LHAKETPDVDKLHFSQKVLAAHMLRKGMSTPKVESGCLVFFPVDSEISQPPC
jgi:hypothetical protein